LPVAAEHTAEWLVALGTCAAVLVALFGPVVRHWWRRPRLSVQRDLGTLLGDELIFAGGDDRSQVLVVTVMVTNHGRSQADEAEAILTALQRFGPLPSENASEEVPEIEVPAVTRGALQFELGRPGDARINIPPKSSRTLQVVMLGTDKRIREELADRNEQTPAAEHAVNGLFCVLPATYADRFTALPQDEPIGVEIQIQARNARPTNWAARLKAWEWESQDEDSLAGVSLEWLEPLTKVRARTPPTPRRAWIKDHTPWALWRARQVDRELARIRAGHNDSAS
jgi:hypothetical protein